MKNKPVNLDEIYMKFKRRDEYYRENYHFARSLGLPAWLAMSIKTRPKEVIAQIAEEYKQKKGECH